MTSNPTALGRLRRAAAARPTDDDAEPAYDYVLGEAAPARAPKPADDDLAVPSVEREHARYSSQHAERLAEERRRAHIPRLRLLPTALAVACLLAIACVVGVLWHARTSAVVAAARPVAMVGVQPTAGAGSLVSPPAAESPGTQAAESPGTHDAEPAGAAAPASAAEPPAPSPAATRFVHVTGAVNHPGVVQVPAGSRAIDAVNAAGGATDDADLDAVNLASALQDGQQVHVPRPGESSQPAPPPATSTAAPGASTTAAAPSAPVNLNTAELADLDALPGIGPALAQRILDWRAENGNFASVDELDEVSGIGPAVLEKLRPLVTTS